MEYRTLFFFVLAGFLSLGQWQCAKESSKSPDIQPPNFVLIMADDLGYGGIGCFNNKTLKTPALDQLAQNGLRFTDYHSNGSVCTPTRAALLTGRYQQRSGMEGVIYARPPSRYLGMDTTELTIAEILQKNGYATGIMGKWHLGYHQEYNPVFQGFDEFYGFLSGNVDYHTHYDNTGYYDWWHNLDSINEEGYVTDLITQHAVDFIEDNQDNPFFLYVSHEAPHVPFQGRSDPGYRFADNEFTYYGPVEDRDRAYTEMVEVMDEGIGSIISTLKNLGLEENTLVVFISDNGAESFGHNGNLNGSKGSLLEGGHRVPAIAHWKGHIEPGTSNETVMSFDWMTTFLALSNTDSPKNLSLDGVDISDHLLNNAPLAKRNLFWRYRNEKSVRQEQYKLLINESDTLLFDLQEDLGETRDIAAENAAKVKELGNALKEWELVMDQVVQKTK